MAALCSLCRETASHTQDGLDNTQLVTVQILLENEVQAQVNENVKTMWSTARVQVTALVDFFQVAAQSNFLISALNTIGTITINPNPGKYDSYLYLTQYGDENSTGITLFETPNCLMVNSIAPAGFYPLSYEQSAQEHNTWPLDPLTPELKPNASAMVDGFFGGCTPLSALLASTLDCLYRQSCLEQFSLYFPALNKVCMSLTLSLENIFFYLDQLELEKSSLHFDTET